MRRNCREQYILIFMKTSYHYPEANPINEEITVLFNLKMRLYFIYV